MGKTIESCDSRGIGVEYGHLWNLSELEPNCSLRPMKTRFTRFFLVFLLLAVACHSAIAQTSTATKAANGVDAKRPWIGITSTIKDGQAQASLRYARAVYESGGLPLVVPIIEDQGYRAEHAVVHRRASKNDPVPRHVVCQSGFKTVYGSSTSASFSIRRPIAFEQLAVSGCSK